MPNTTRKIQAFNLAAGQKPSPDQHDPSGAMVLRGWQAKGYAALHGHVLRVLLAPTGSGKSTLIKSLGADELQSNTAMRVVVAVPQVVIAASFGASQIRVDGRLLTWGIDPANDLIKANGSAVSALVAFVRGKPGLTPQSRTVVCSHQTLVLAHQRLMRDAGKGKAKRSPWHDVSLYVDEAHHSRAESDADVGDGETDADAKRLNNRLGQLVAHWLDAAPGPLLLATATWLRANLAEIVPKGRMGEFTKYVLTMEDHLASMQHLREVAFRFLIGEPADALRALYAESNAKTIAWLPHVNSPHVKALGGKQEALATYQEAVGKVVGVDTWTTTLRHKPAKGKAFEVRTLDYVSEDGRESRQRELVTAIPKGASHTPDLLWALGMGKEGFDWPELSRAIVIGERGSIPDVLQMMGRIMRDYPGKARAEIDVILPTASGADPEQVRAYLKTILASMVVESQFIGAWRWRKPVVEGADDAADGNNQSVDDTAEAAAVIGNVVDTVLRDPKASERPDDVVKAALNAAGVKADDEERAEIAKRVKGMFAARTKAMLAQMGDVGGDADVTEDVFGCVRILGMSFGYSTLAELREALGQREAWATVEEVRERMAQWESENGRKITVTEYRAARGDWGRVFPDQSEFQRVYGKTLAEVRDGARRGTCATEDDVREHVRTWELSHGRRITAAEYNSIRSEWGPRFPHSGEFKNKYDGASFGCIVRGVGRSPVTMTVLQIRSLADAHMRKHGSYPEQRSGHVDGMPGLTWATVDARLRHGWNGFPGGSSLSLLLKGPKRGLSIQLINAWALEHCAKTGKVPTNKAKDEVGMGCDWQAINVALKYGRRGLPGGSSLSKLLREHGLKS